jgi:fucose 4-O-acetylase-like acetyltransferase
MSSVEAKNRIDWIDMAKGYGMLAVIIAHICVGPLHTWIYTFHMPLFFFLSGYVFNNNPSFKELINRKAKTLVFPYFTLGIPMVVFPIFINLYKGLFSVGTTIELLKSFIFQKRLWTLWYIACLFFLNVFFYIITKFVKNNVLRGAIVTMLACIGLLYYKVGGLPLPWNIDVCFTALPFFFIGYLLKHYKEKSEKIVEIIAE